jgi:hypothetical protein
MINERNSRQEAKITFIGKKKQETNEIAIDRILNIDNVLNWLLI